MFGPVETNLDELTVSRFISCLVGTGKTTQMLWSINRILESGETCLLVTPSTYIVKEYFPDRKLPEGLTVIHIDKLLKYLKRYNPEEHSENVEINLDYRNMFYRYVELFNCDRVIIDPDCYIKIIEQFVEKMKNTQALIDKFSKIWRKF